MGLRDYLAIIGRRWAAFTLGCGGLFGLLTAVQAWSGNRYTAEAVLAIGPQHPMADVLEALMEDRPQSRLNVQQVVRRLWHDPETAHQISSRMRDEHEAWDLGPADLPGTVSLDYEREEQRYRLRTTSDNRDEAVTLVNVAAAVLGEGIQTGLKTDIETKLSVLRLEYEKAVRQQQEERDRLDEFRRRHGLLPEERSVHEAVDRLRAQRRRLSAEADGLHAERVRLEEGVAEPPETPEVAAARERAAVLEADATRLAERYTDAHSLVRIAKERLLEARAELARAREAAFQGRRRELESSEADRVGQVELLARQVSDLLSPEIREDVSRSLSREESLGRTVSEARRRLDDWSRHLELLARTSWVSQAADRERVSIRPWTSRLGLFGLLAVIVGLSLAFVREVLDDTVTDEHHLQRYGNLECLGAIPQAQETELLLLGAAPTSPLFEQFNRLATVVVNRLESRHGKILLVTSPKHDDGKTTVAVDLAIALAALGRRTVLVDADLHRPTLHALFGQPAVPGLSTFLEGRLGARAFLDQVEREARGAPTATYRPEGDLMIGDLRALQELEPAEPAPPEAPAPSPRLPVPNPEAVALVARATQVENLKLLTAGAPPANPGGLIDSAGCEALLAAVARDHDVVVVDSSPALGTSPPLAMARRADLTLLVTRAGYTRREELQAARRSLLQSGARAIVGVLNAARKRREAAYYYYGREAAK